MARFISWLIALLLSVPVLSLVGFVDEVNLQLKVLDFVTALDAQNVPHWDRGIAVYHVGNTIPEDSLDVAENNIKLFLSAIEQHSKKSRYHVFYVVAIVGGHNNPLSKHMLPNLPNTVFIKGIHHNHGDVMTLFSTVTTLGEPVIAKFGTVLFLHSGARGPLYDRADGQWWKHFVEPLRSDADKIGMVGPTISCDGSPHIQTYTLACRSDVAIALSKDEGLKRGTRKRNNAFNIEFMISTDVQNMGYKLSSLYDRQMRKLQTFDGQCMNGTANSVYFASNPTSWCELGAAKLPFIRWGGAPLRVRGYYCEDTITHVRQRTIQIARTEKKLLLVLPETIYGVPWYAAMKNYDLENWRDHSVVPQTLNSLSRGGEQPQKVCLVVRTSMAHGDIATKTSRVVPMNLRLFIATLLRQSNPNWEAYFIVTDDQPFDEELQAILRDYSDYRLNYLPLDMKFRPKYDPVEAGYPASDEAMRIVMQKPQCAWISVTNGDNAYGSDVINVALQTEATQKKDLVLVPMDSRNFANEVYQTLRAQRGRYEGWQEHCRDFEDRVLHHPMGFARASRANVGGVDIAAMFIDREKFLRTNISFNTYARTDKTCIGCQDGLWTDKMVHEKGWSISILPLVDMRTIVFHGPSPLWCIAGGHVWLDHPKHTQCLSYKTAASLQHNPHFDWARFASAAGKRTCLRLSEYGVKEMFTSNVTYFH